MSSKRLLRSSLIAIVVIGLVAVVLARAKVFVPASNTVLLPTSTAAPAGGQSPSPEPAFQLTILPSGTPGPAVVPGPTQASPKDGMRLVRVPAGDFLMGSDPGHDPAASADKSPQHDVRLSEYWIDQTDVTNGMYARCAKTGSCSPPQVAESSTHADYATNPAYADFPVINVDWTQAQAYCQWAGRRLPTEAEWEKAARGADGRIYPWGNQAPDATLANFNTQVGDTTRAGSYPAGASPYGALDMAGNVWNWLSDWYAAGYAPGPSANPSGPTQGQAHVLRGGSWHNGAPLVRSADRGQSLPAYWSNNVGFRCALTP